VVLDMTIENLLKGLILGMPADAMGNVSEHNFNC
jgi:hypothetical protein